MLRLNEDSNGQEIQLTTGEVAQLSLPENRMTGYRWQIESDGEPTVQLTEQPIEKPSSPPGAGGRREWQLRATQPGDARIQLVSRRPWMSQESESRAFSLRVRVVN